MMTRQNLAPPASAPPGSAGGAAARTSIPTDRDAQDTRAQGLTHTLVLTGELDRSSAPTLEAAIEQLCEAGVAGITLDLSGLDRIDLTGVAVIAFRSRSCARRGHRFALRPGPPAIQHVFEAAGQADRLPFLTIEGGAPRGAPAVLAVPDEPPYAGARSARGAGSFRQGRSTSTRRARRLAIAREPGEGH